MVTFGITALGVQSENAAPGWSHSGTRHLKPPEGARAVKLVNRTRIPAAMTGSQRMRLTVSSRSDH